MNKITAQLHFNKIIELNLLRKIEDEALREILENATILSKEKEEICFFQDEEIKKIEILLSGKVKLTIGNLDGKKTTIKIINEATLLNPIFAKNQFYQAETLEKSTILSISKKIFEELAQKYPKFCFNLLAEQSAQNQDLITKISGLKIKNAQEKVGEFLLENSFSGNKKMAFSEIEENKYEIASCLNITPETFSRTLKKLQEDGEIMVDKNQITLTQKNSLCQFCNQKISNNCQDRNQNFCTQNDK